MHGPATSAMSAILFGLAAFFAVGAATQWLKLGKDREKPNERPVIPVHAFRSAAVTTALTLGLIGAALAWSALLAIS